MLWDVYECTDELTHDPESETLNDDDGLDASVEDRLGSSATSNTTDYVYPKSAS